MEENRQLTAESVPFFTEGIGLLLSRWSALQIAIENEWGGRDSRRKAELLASDVFAFFTQTKGPLYIYDLENILEEALLTLNTMADDGSIEEVAEKLMIMHEECLECDFQSIERMRATNPPPRVAHFQKVNDDDDDDDDDDDADDGDSMTEEGRTSMMVDLPMPKSNSNAGIEVDVSQTSKQAAESEDGWVVVSSRRSKGKTK